MLHAPNQLPPADDVPLPETSSRHAPVKEGSLLKRLSARHHRLAQCLGDGMAPGDAALICGYTLNRVSVLQTDPSFKALIQFYSAQRQEAFIDTGKRLADLADTAIDLIQERLENEPDTVPTPQLLAVAQAALDRSGHGPTQTQRNINVSLSAEELQRLRSNALATQSGVVKLLPAQQGTDGGSAPGTGAPTPAGADSGSPQGAPVRETRDEVCQSVGEALIGELLPPAGVDGP